MANYGVVIAGWHYCNVIMSAIASQFTGVSMVCSTVCSGADQRKHQSSASLAFVGGIHKEPVTRRMFPLWWRHHGTKTTQEADSNEVCQVSRNSILSSNNVIITPKWYNKYIIITLGICWEVQYLSHGHSRPGLPFPERVSSQAGCRRLLKDHPELKAVCLQIGDGELLAGGDYDWPPLLTGSRKSFSLKIKWAVKYFDWLRILKQANL